MLRFTPESAQAHRVRMFIVDLLLASERLRAAKERERGRGP
jgi:hypothetical protein